MVFVTHQLRVGGEIVRFPKTSQVSMPIPRMMLARQGRLGARMGTSAGLVGRRAAGSALGVILRQPHPAPIGPSQHRPFSISGTARRARQDPRDDDDAGAREPSLRSKMLESAATTLASVLVLGGGFAFAGYAYHKMYKHLQLRKMKNAFEPGDPVLALAAVAKEVPEPDAEHWIVRQEQERIDAIINGEEQGHYFLIMGEKGSGKSSSKRSSTAGLPAAPRYCSPTTATNSEPCSDSGSHAQGQGRRRLLHV